ncbi:MAG: hypothetical protein U1F83_08220 [Verrucomicrobiota bacterium]
MSKRSRHSSRIWEIGDEVAHGRISGKLSQGDLHATVKTRKLGILLSSIALLSTAVDAATVNIHQDLDLSGVTINNGIPNSLFQDFNFVPLTPIEAGDTVNLTFNFLNGRLTVANSSTMSDELNYVIPGLSMPFWSYCTFGIGNIQVSFLDAISVGGAQTDFFLGSQTQLNSQQGMSPALVDFLPNESSLSFSGIQTSYHVDFLNSSSYISLFGPFLLVVADQVEITPIPEPSVYAFAAASLLMGGTCIHRLRKETKLRE